MGKLYAPGGVRFPANVEYGDVVKGLPLEIGSCTGIYASHVLEHLSLEDFRIAIRHTYRLLQRSGRFRLVVPDLEILARRYLDTQQAEAAEIFVRETSLGKIERPRGLRGFVRAWLGNSQHLWMWDFKALKAELTSAGFVNIRRCEFGDSDDPKFLEVEVAERFVDALAVEGMKL